MGNAVSDIPELLNLNADRSIVRIPMEQDVPFTDRVRDLVDTAEYQRLHHITQLGLAARVYPGATHTRFEHALGVFHNALKYLWQLARDPRFCDVVDRHTGEVLIVAALLHDLGHWPFCHPIEDMSLPDLPPHEAFAAEFLAKDRGLAKVLDEQWGIDPSEVLDVLVKRTDSAPMRLVRSILSGPIDIDKMDYLERDSLHAGVPYGRNFDKNRLIQSLVVNEAGDGLAITVKGKTAAELMVFARYVMFSEVYWHHAVRSATCMFARGFYELHQQLDLVSLFQSTESETIEVLRQSARGTLCESLMEGVFGPRRVLHKRVVEYSMYQVPELYFQLARRPYEFLVRCGTQLARLISTETDLDVGPVDIVIDAPPPHREVEFKVDIYYPKEDVYRPLKEVSPIVNAMSGTEFDHYVKRVRVFANPKISQALTEMPEFPDFLRRAAESSSREA
ncbi:MAG: metal-dependent phosphohydrolase [Planctomycetaceae bacterium]|nr:metal-dependent phosphohydrolase [Planctomycetaceae bacterium]